MAAHPKSSVSGEYPLPESRSFLDPIGNRAEPDGSEINLGEVINAYPVSFYRQGEPAIKPFHLFRPNPEPRDSSKTPDWLPVGWTMETRERKKGVTCGSIDRYYISPWGKKYRSKREVEEAIEEQRRT